MLEEGGGGTHCVALAIGRAPMYIRWAFWFLFLTKDPGNVGVRSVSAMLQYGTQEVEAVFTIGNSGDAC